MALLVLLAVNLVLRTALIFRLNFNWDEFHYLSKVYDYLASRPLPLNQTFHVHLFCWLPGWTTADEAGQLMVARAVLLALSIGTALLLYAVTRRFFSVEASLLATLGYFSLSEIMVHGASFRPDPMAAFLGLAAIWVTTRDRAPVAESAVAGSLVGFSMLLTSKSIFWLPGLAALLLFQGSYRRRARFLHLAVLGSATAVSVIALSLLHRSSLAASPTFGRALTGLGRAGQKVLGGEFFPRKWYLIRSLLENPLVWLLILGGLGIVLAGLFSRRPARRRTAVVLLALAVPMFTIALYRNAFPYFYVFALAPASLLVAQAFDQLGSLRASGRLRRALLWIVAIGVFVTGLRNFREHRWPMQAAQRQVIATVHEMFPEPVPYIDRCSMISSFPKVGFFFSSWGMENYRAGLTRPLTEVVRDHHPPFLLANTPTLNLQYSDEFAMRLPYALTREDWRTLRKTYIHHWGIIFVAGKRLDFPAAEPVSFEILVPGIYTLEADMAIRLDGERLLPGETIGLEVGLHTAWSENPTYALLRWGNRLYRPTEEPIRMPIFVGF